jgi:hypothetical protein
MVHPDGRAIDVHKINVDNILDDGLSYPSGELQPTISTDFTDERDVDVFVEQCKDCTCCRGYVFACENAQYEGTPCSLAGVCGCYCK